MEHPDAGMLACMKLHEAADYFLLSQLSESLEEELFEKLRVVKWSILQAYPRETAKVAGKRRRSKLFDLLPQDERVTLFQAIDHAFLRDYQNTSIQSLFSELASNTNFWILHDKACREKIFSVPQLATSVLGQVMDSSLGQVFHTVPRKCGHGKKHGEPVDVKQGRVWENLGLVSAAREMVVGYKDCYQGGSCL